MSSQRDPEGVEPQWLDDFADLKQARVLEIGCGDGRLTWRYAESANRVTGIDPDAERLQTALEALPSTLTHVTFVQAHAEDLPFRRETFDIGLLAWSL
jgi:ubiquinone/menaquinone biosynthesis C-methylase UbiE